MKTPLIRFLLALMVSPVLAMGKTPAPLELRITPDREYMLRSGERDLVFKIDLNAADRTSVRRLPLNVAVVLDRSGSMQGAKIEKARQAACVVIDQLSERDTFALVTYDNDVDVLIPARHVTDPESLKRTVNRIKCGGSTALYAGVESGAAQLAENLSDSKVNRVILLSDGLANVGPQSSSDLARLGTRLREKGISVTTIGVGDDYNENLMVALAEASAANYYYVKDAEKLPKIFAEELGNMKSIMARGIRIIIQLPEGVEPIEVLGRPDIHFRERTAELTLNEIYGAQKRFYLVRCKLPAEAADSMTVASVRMEYEDAEGAERREATASASVQVTEDAALAEKSRNKEIRVDAALAENVVARERALQYADEGKVAEAVTLLKAQAAAIAGLPASPKAAGEADALRDTAADLESAGSFNNRTRKEFQFENWKQKNQK